VGRLEGESKIDDNEKEWLRNYGREDREDQRRRYEDDDLDKKGIFKTYLKFKDREDKKV